VGIAILAEKKEALGFLPATPIQESPNLEKTVDRSRRHVFNRGLTTEEWVRVMDLNPLIRERLIREKNVQSLINAKDKRDPFKCIHCERRVNVAFLHIEECGPRRPAQ
jgi:hypothetical protein